MTPQQRINLKRLLSPRHVAFVGGNSAALAARQCADAGFAGPIWGVNPRRSELGGQPCFASVDALPEAPDAVFLAMPVDAAVETVASLARIGAGGAVCYTAGFRETGSDGAAIERDLIAASGDLALVGPNCLGILNYVNKTLLWPFGHGAGPIDRGVAIVSQSGLFCTNLTMSRRSVPFAYLISCGNQAVIGIEDLIDTLIDDPLVSAIGVYCEGLRDIHAFAEAAARAVEQNIPIVILKAGSSETGAKITATHTGSLSGTDSLFDALFERLGVIRVRTPTELLETLKLLDTAGAPAGNRIAAVTCSGGDATVLADLGERNGLTFPQPSAAAGAALRKTLPPIATVSNPLDYTPPLWGKREELEAMFGALLSDGYDAALFVQDFVVSQDGRDPETLADNQLSLIDSAAFIAATNRAGIPAFVVSSIAENLPESARRVLLAGRVAPLQGVDTAVTAIAGAIRFGRLRVRQQDKATARPLSMPPVAFVDIASASLLDEFSGKQIIAAAGIEIPLGQRTSAADAPAVAAAIGFPVAVKLVHADLPHKTEAGAVRLALNSAAEVAAAVEDIRLSVERFRPGMAADRFLVERMVPKPIAELLVGIRHDPLFGPVMLIGTGGTLVEIWRDTATLLLPTDPTSIRDALLSLRIAPLLHGHRGAPAADIEGIVKTIFRLAQFGHSQRGRLVELDVNPLMILPDRAIAADVLLRIVETVPGRHDDGANRMGTSRQAKENVQQ